MKTLQLMIATLLLSGFTFSSAFANEGRIETVAGLKSLLAGHDGQYATAIYGAGTQSFITTGNNQISFFRIRVQSQPKKISDGQVTFPSVRLKRDGITVAFNMIAIVIHEQQAFSWANADGSIPQGSAAGNPAFVKVIGITKIEYNSLMESQNNPAVLTIDKY
ncbi:MAG: hypothetical protein AB7O96_05050 [Pseudobdellovibrionaceae bacterium]